MNTVAIRTMRAGNAPARREWAAMRRTAGGLLILSVLFGMPDDVRAAEHTAHKVPLAGHLVPAFTLPDTQGKPHSLAEFRGRPVVLFFFCGCAPCHDCARAWAQAQQSGELETGPHSPRPSPSSSATPRTVIVYTGDAHSAQGFLTETDIDSKQTQLLTDADAQIAARYGAMRCPRVFVVDARGYLAYTNPPPGNEASTLSATALVSRTITAIRGCDALAKTDPVHISASQPRQSKGKSHAH